LAIGSPPLFIHYVSPAQADSLQFVLQVQPEVRAGAPLPIKLRLTNTGARPVELHLLGRDIAFDVVVSREDGSPVWRRLEHAVVPGILQVKVLAPGESLELHAEWRQTTSQGGAASPGIYMLQGVLPTDEPEPLRTTVVRVKITAKR
jgi:hypothetical protein